MKHRILLVDDEPDILEFVGYNLLKAGYEVFTARDGAEGLRMAVEHRPHLILLDRMMPVMDGVETCRRIREQEGLSQVMVVFLSALGEEEQQIEGFDAGADDYIPKPIRMKVLMSRVAAILKRVAADGSLRIDRERHLVYLDGRPLPLPRKEFALLALLSSEPGPRGDLRPGVGNRGGSGRPHHRCPRPQAPPEARRPLHLDGQGARVQVPELSLFPGPDARTGLF